jgi:PAS domain S-box-containing protein
MTTPILPPKILLIETDQALADAIQAPLGNSRTGSFDVEQVCRLSDDDTIERQAIEDALNVENERAQFTLNSIGNAVLCTDICGKITYLNLVAKKMTGWSREEAAGRCLPEVFKIVDGETRQTAPDPVERAFRQNKTVGMTVNCVLIRRDGCESAVEGSAAPIHDRAGQVIGTVIVFHDVRSK